MNAQAPLNEMLLRTDKGHMGGEMTCYSLNVLLAQHDSEYIDRLNLAQISLSNSHIEEH